MNQRMISGSKGGTRPRILAFYGSDLSRMNSEKFLRKARDRGYELVALDSSAMASARAADVIYSVLEDHLDPATIAEALKEAGDARTKWFEPARALFTVEGICWPEMDQFAMHAAWQNAFLAMKWAEKLKRDGVQGFGFFRHIFPRFQVGWERSDIAAALWEQELSGIATPWMSFEAFHPGRVLAGVGRGVKRILSRRRRLTRLQESDPIGTGRIFLVMADLETLRFSDLVLSLHERFPDKISVAMSKAHPKVSDDVSWTDRVPVVYGPLSPPESWEAWTTWRLLGRNRFRHGERFRQGYSKALEAAARTPWAKPLGAMKFHFEYYGRLRWPWLCERSFPWWQSLWNRTRPSAVLCSSLEDPAVLTAVAAAKGLGIPTLSVPHGGIHLCYSLPMTDYVLYGNAPQRSIYEGLGVPDCRLLPCRQLVSSSEYRVTRHEPFSDSRKLRLLALTDPTDIGTNLHNLLSLRGHFIALKALTHPPEEMGDKIELVVKVHPGYSDLAMIDAIGPALRAKVLPPSSDLHLALREADLVVAVNYWGTALIHVLLAGKPVVFLLTESDALINSGNRLFGLFRDATTVARTPEEFWKLIQSFMSDPAVPLQMEKKALDFAATMLNFSDFPGVDEYIDRLVFGKE